MHGDSRVVAIRYVPTVVITGTERVHICYSLHGASCGCLFRRGCGSVIIQGAKRVYQRSKVQEKAGGDFAGFFSKLVCCPTIFMPREHKKKSARVRLNSPEALQSVGQPSPATSSLPVCVIP